VFEQCSLGVLPKPLLARLMPEWIQICLNIDFLGGGKIDPGRVCRAVKRTRQKLPEGGKKCRVTGKYFHFA
jgi:hypothetical protein